MAAVLTHSTSYFGRRSTSSHRPSIRVFGHNLEEDRHTYTYPALQNKYPIKIADGDVRPAKQPVTKRVKSFIQSVFPIIEAITTYQKGNLVSDLIAGLSVGFLHMPQALAYSVLASLPLASGLYTSVFPIVIYAMFGSSVHTSMGTNSIVSLLTADMVERELQRELDKDGGARLALTTKESQDEFKISIAMASAMLCGTMLLLMGVLRLGFVTSYLPSSFVGGFTTAAAFLIVTTQVSKAVNIKVPLFSGVGKVFKIYQYILTHIADANLADIITNLTTFTILIAFTFINPKLKPKLKMNIPANLLVVTLGTVLSYLFRGKEHFGLRVVGPVPDGFYHPMLPNISNIKFIIQDSAAMALITFSLNISMAIMFGKLHHQIVNTNRELVAYGMCNLLSFPFHCHVSSVSPARCMILNNEEAKTTLHSIPTCIFLFVVIMKFGHLFEELPVAVLAAVVFMAVAGLLAQAKQLPNLWRVNRTDFVVWIVTFLATAFIDLMYGLVIGVVVAAIGVIANNQNVTGTIMVKATKENVFLHGDNRHGVQHVKNIRIFHFPSQLCYFNAEAFKTGLFQKVFDPTKRTKLEYEIVEEDGEMVMANVEESIIRCIIIECSAISYIDMDGINMLKTVVLQFQQAGVQVLMARCLEKVYNALDRAQFFDILPQSCVFYELRDAVHEEWQTREGISKMALQIDIVPTPRLHSTYL